MSGEVIALPRGDKPQVITLTPDLAVELLEYNRNNRPLKDNHVKRIAKQIIEDKWRYNGDTIKIAASGDVLDGQHRLWAVIEAKKSVETVIVKGIHRDAFATIDAIRQPRNASDIIALMGSPIRRQALAGALQWLVRYQEGTIEKYRAPQNRVENSDVETAFENHPQMERAVERAAQLRGLANQSIMAFLYYILTNRDEFLAERMMQTLEDPGRVSVEDPFFKLRQYFTADHHKRKHPVTTIALAIKAINAAKAGKKIKHLTWRSQGSRPETFPALDF